MKIFKRTVSLFLAFCLCAGMLLLQPQSTVSAAVRNKPTTTVGGISFNGIAIGTIVILVAYHGLKAIGKATGTIAKDDPDIL